MQELSFASQNSKEAQATLYACYFSLQAALLAIDRPNVYHAALNSFYAAYDTYIGIVTAEMKPTCRSGCSHCCYDNPHGVSGAELAYIYDLIQDDPRYPRWKASIEQRSREFHQLKRANPEGNIQINWKDKLQPCVFLGDDKRCMIYQRRPVACRMFFSLTPPKQCHPEDPNYKQAINPHLEPSSAIKDLLKQISKVLNLNTLPSDFISGLSQLMKTSDKGKNVV